MSDHPTPLGGTCSARFDPLRELFAAKLESGEDLGASLALNIDGEMVVDLWGGWADLARTVPWTENTITNVFSTTKSMTSLRLILIAAAGRALHARHRPDGERHSRCKAAKAMKTRSETGRLNGCRRSRPISLFSLRDDSRRQVIGRGGGIASKIPACRRS